MDFTEETKKHMQFFLNNNKKSQYNKKLELHTLSKPFQNIAVVFSTKKIYKRKVSKYLPKNYKYYLENSNKTKQLLNYLRL